MANAILNQLAIPSQFKTPPFFTLQFSTTEWQLFWRLMVVGCIMSDHLIEAAEQSHGNRIKMFISLAYFPNILISR